MPMQPHVFVVMPFGVKEAQARIPASTGTPEKAAIDVDFNEVYDLLIGPALSTAGCLPFRADEEPGAGDIRTDMFFELVTADIILADISILNANVFYELGVRHGVRARGVLMIHGGWSSRPFDVAPDRTFDYDGSLFAVKKEDRDAAWQRRLDDQTKRLSAALAGAVHVEERTVGSPVYGQLVGMKEADWSDIETAKAKYFGEVFSDWKGRVDVAKLNGWPGDILTLADDAPTRFHRSKLLWHAADCLCSMEYFDAALRVLQDLLADDPNHRDAKTRLGLVLGRLGKVNEAKVHMLGVVKQFEHDTEAHGIMGRVFKDLWRLEWSDAASLKERQQQAVSTSKYAVSAIRSYDEAARKKFDYYNGINVVSLVKLLEFLRQATGEAPAASNVTDLDDLVSVVRFAARNALDCAGLEGGQDAVWAGATLGELAIVAGDRDTARTYYRDAANAPGTTYFTVKSMLAQIELFEKLGFNAEAVSGVKNVLESRKRALEERVPALTRSRFGKVAVASGHMTDAPGRSKERFPARKAQAVRDRTARQLDQWGIGKGDLAICGGARGTDILFAELCIERGAEVWLFLALPEPDFLRESVRLPDSDWQERFFSLRGNSSVKTFQQMERLKWPPKGTSPFSRNNLWIINTARVEANEPKNLHALLVWDEEPTGDGPGGTSDFAARIQSLGGRMAVINPLHIEA